VIGCINEKQLLTAEKLAAAFRMFDKDGSGLISKDEIQSILSFDSEQLLSMKVVDEIIAQIDENEDGEISFEEFSIMMKRLAS
jgi:Ca2+-binding EF-hand superfamily protein